ncbi:MAG: UTP--glucose-1-phosphate uridylyltransferase [Pontiellaceae bacterium]|nr:UTP--glucose-1-phosphate uridylyltransferase [Pontiellaceae bacterium]
MNIEKLTENKKEQALIAELLAAGQAHLFADWDAPGIHDDAKTAFLQSLVLINDSYPGGLTGYISNARKLLAAAQTGSNPFDGFVPHHPNTVDLTQFNESYDHYEALGAAHFEKTAVVLVAGGLGERLGYSGIKLDIPVEVTENTTYLAHYAACLRAMEARMATPHPVPLIIMVSEDTRAKTIASLEASRFFGLKKEQIHLLKQEPVPALADNEGHLALEKKYKLVLKPHGHGDVHMLLASSGLAAKLEKQGIGHLVFIQDTNGQVFNALPAALGVSVEQGYDFNSIAVNLLRATVSPAGDVPDAEGFSIFPGNINALVIKMNSYVRILERTQGIIAEFINPKYADATRTSFKSPTRLETMMQDLPGLFGPDEKVGVTIFDRRWSFSANKNNLKDAAAKHAAGGPPESGATAESDFYLAGRMKLAAAGMKIKTAGETLLRNIPFTPGPRVLLCPSFAMTLAEVRQKIKGGSISGEATLLLDGKNITLEKVAVAAGSALVIKAVDGAVVTVKNLTVKNDGFELVRLSDEEQNSSATPEYLRLRGYRIENRAAAVYEFTAPGEYIIQP